MAKNEKQYSKVPKTSEPKVSQLDSSETFLIVNVEDKWRIGVSGRWVTKKIFNSYEEAQAYIDSKPWDLIMNLAGLIAEYIIKEINNNK